MQNQIQAVRIAGGLQVAGFSLCFCGIAARRLSRLYAEEKAKSAKKRIATLTAFLDLVDGAISDYGGVTQAKNGIITGAALQKVILTEAALCKAIMAIFKVFKIADFAELKNLALQRRSKDYEEKPLRVQKELSFLENLTDFLESRGVDNFDVLKERAAQNV